MRWSFLTQPHVRQPPVAARAEAQCNETIGTGTPAPSKLRPSSGRRCSAAGAIRLLGQQGEPLDEYPSVPSNTR
jgi:hypothetical protein